MLHALIVGCDERLFFGDQAAELRVAGLLGSIRRNTKRLGFHNPRPKLEGWTGIVQRRGIGERPNSDAPVEHVANIGDAAEVLDSMSGIVGRK